MHANLKLYTDAADKIDYNAMFSCGAARFEPYKRPGEVQLWWDFYSKEDVINHLKLIICILEHSEH